MERKERETKKAPPGPFTVSCQGFGKVKRDHLWQVRSLSYDEKGNMQVSEVSGWIPREELEKKFPEARDSGSHIFCPSCREKFRNDMRKQIEALKKQT